MDKNELIALISAVQNGDSDAATVLYDTFQKDLYYHIYKTVNDPHLAEDLLQDAFIEILQTINNLKEPAAFLSWSKQIAYHKCTAYFKRRKEILADENEDGLSVFDTIEEENAEFIPDEALDKDDLKQTIHAIINDLPEDQRSALLMRYFDEISVKEIAEIQGVTEGTVKSRLNYGRKSIKQAIENYEKKNNIKLRCVGVVPLLLWLFREFAVSNGISLTANTASAAYTAGNTASIIAEGATVAAKSTAKVAAKATAKAAVKTTTKLAAEKIIAGIAAATIITGSVTAALLLRPETTNEPEPEASYISEPSHTTESEPAPEPVPMVWIGYDSGDDIAFAIKKRFELTIYEMNDTRISGHLKVERLYNTTHDTDFTGVGIKTDNSIKYTVTFESPIIAYGLDKYEINDMQLKYDKTKDRFTFIDIIYNVKLDRVSTEKPNTLFENERWTGEGKNEFNNSSSKDHQFELNVYKMTETDISGHLTVSYKGEIEHTSEFTGRGYIDKYNVIHYEILLETALTKKGLSDTITEDRFWMIYNIEKDTFKINHIFLFNVVMHR